MITCDGVVKRFGELTAVDGVSFELESGKVLSLLGHNGAGKTTLLRLITGLYRPDSGRVVVEGRDPIADGCDVRARLGMLPSSRFVDSRLTGRENLMFAGRLWSLPDEVIEDRAGWLLEEFDLSERRDDLVSTYSSGMRQRLALARVLLPEPTLLLLDEPTASMDPVAARDFRNLLVERLLPQGRAVVLATHDLDEAAELSDEVLIMARGRVLAQGTPTELVEALAGRLDVEVAPTVTATALQVISRLGGEATTHKPGCVTVSGWPRSAIPELVRSLVDAGVDLYGVFPSLPSLEDVYFSLHEDLEELEELAR